MNLHASIPVCVVHTSVLYNPAFCSKDCKDMYIHLRVCVCVCVCVCMCVYATVGMTYHSFMTLFNKLMPNSPQRQVYIRRRLLVFECLLIMLGCGGLIEDKTWSLKLQKFTVLIDISTMCDPATSNRLFQTHSSLKSITL